MAYPLVPGPAADSGGIPLPEPSVLATLSGLFGAALVVVLAVALWDHRVARTEVALTRRTDAGTDWFWEIARPRQRVVVIDLRESPLPAASAVSAASAEPAAPVDEPAAALAAAVSTGPPARTDRHRRPPTGRRPVHAA